MEVKEKIIAIIDTIRPFLISDGGDTEFVKFEDGIVYIKITGACLNCDMLDITISSIIKETLMDEIKEVKDVVAI
jgi:Fe-S cluster biogenesis protein NfuA